MKNDVSSTSLSPMVWYGANRDGTGHGTFSWRELVNAIKRRSLFDGLSNDVAPASGKAPTPTVMMAPAPEIRERASRQFEPHQSLPPPEDSQLKHVDHSTPRGDVQSKRVVKVYADDRGCRP